MSDENILQRDVRLIRNLEHSLYTPHVLCNCLTSCWVAASNTVSKVCGDAVSRAVSSVRMARGNLGVDLAEEDARD